MGLLTGFYYLCAAIMIIVGLTALPYGLISVGSAIFLIFVAKWESDSSKLEEGKELEK